jgi:hypothetical protein
MEVSVTDFRNNISTYFDKVYFEKEDIILKKRGYKLKLTYELDDDFSSKDELNFDNALKSEVIKNKLSLLATKI